MKNDKQRKIKGNFLIMYDTDAPNGERNNKNNKIYIHYLKIGKHEVIPYNGPTPPNGIHNYYAKSIRLTKEQKIKLKDLLKDKKKRTDEIYQNLTSDNISFDDIKIDKNQILRETSFKVKG